jgi:hypothetical protein
MTLFGKISFDAAGTTTANWKCFQVQHDRSLRVVFAPNDTNLALTPLVYPAYAPVPPGYYRKLTRGRESEGERRERQRERRE